MLTEGPWYTLPDGTRVQAREQTIRGTWHLVATDGTPAYVVFAGDQVRRLVFTAIVTDNPGAEGHPTPLFQAAPCDLTLADLRPAPAPPAG
jgi:hypothetical protein